jgi:hypothetical protein
VQVIITCEKEWKRIRAKEEIYTLSEDEDEDEDSSS